MHKQWSLSNANYSAVSNVCFKLGISTVYPTPIYLPVHLILVNGDTLIQFQFKLQNVQFIKIAPIMNLITRPHHSESNRFYSFSFGRRGRLAKEWCPSHRPFFTFLNLPLLTKILCNRIFKIYAKAVTDLGFSSGGQLSKWVNFANFLPKTAWKWKNSDPRGHASLAPPLDPPMKRAK